jgi:predicted CoA-substrate-specific enzyme activase
MQRVVAGIDVGALSTEAVLLDEQARLLGYGLVYTGASTVRAAESAYASALAQAGLTASDVAVVVSTGYGRARVPFAASQVTEITAHARGAHHLFPGLRTVIDVGGQDAKAIRLGERGRVLDFAMNDKCAAGTGRFLEVMARALEIDLDEMGRLSLQARSPVSVSSTCTVFAESEVVSLIAQGHPQDEIIAGLHNAIADRVASLVQRVGLAEPVAMTGGVAKNAGVVRALEGKLGVRLLVPPEPQIVGALGAALIALERGPQQPERAIGS